MVSRSTIGASQIALSIQNPSQSGPRTQGDGHFRIRGVAVAISTTAAGAVSKVSLRRLPLDESPICRSTNLIYTPG